MNLSARFEAQITHWFGTDHGWKGYLQPGDERVDQFHPCRLGDRIIGLGFESLLVHWAAFYKGWADETITDKLDRALRVPGSPQCDPHHSIRLVMINSLVAIGILHSIFKIYRVTSFHMGKGIRP